MTDFMSQDSGELRFVLQMDQQAAADGDESPGKSEGVRGGIVDHPKGIGEVGPLAESAETPADVVHIRIEAGIGIFAPHLLQGTREGLFAYGDFLGDRHLKKSQLLLSGCRIDRTTATQQEQNKQERKEMKTANRTANRHMDISDKGEPARS
jgi:hypothetical protein